MLKGFHENFGPTTMKYTDNLTSDGRSTKIEKHYVSGQWKWDPLYLRCKDKLKLLLDFTWSNVTHIVLIDVDWHNESDSRKAKSIDFC